ncbi:MAG TPA: sulfotransferase [Terriglobales bacterium]|nr:sulfotransferase [Terriglobales bacterium]
MGTAGLSSAAAQMRTRARARAPVFVVGSPRSGTTLLYHMILSAGNFALYRSETHIFNVFAPHYGNLAVRGNRQKMVDEWLQSKYFKLAGLDAEETRAHLMRDCGNPGDFLCIVMESIARSQKVERWAENTPEHVLYLREIKRTIPEALFIHIIRDGRDVALSLDKKRWVQSFPWDRKQGPLVCGLYWEWMVRAGRKAGPLLGPDYMEVRYEDLVQEPRQTLARIGQFIEHDLDYDHILQVGIGSVSEPETSFPGNHAESPFNPVGRWKNSLPPKQLARLERLLAPCLTELGYPLSQPEDALLSSPRLRLVRAQYLAYFSFRLWLKSSLPFARHLVDVQWLREHSAAL